MLIDGGNKSDSSLIYSVLKKANVQKGESVVIFGAGTIGLLCGMWAKDFGAENVYFVDIDQKN